MPPSTPKPGRFSLSGQVAVITGAARGIGKAIAEEFAARGASMVLVDRDPAVEQVAAGGLALQADVSIKEEVDRFFAAALAVHPRIDVLVNNAAHARYEWSTQLSLEDWEYTLRNSLTSVFLCSQVAARHMTDAGGGRIINISSASANVVHRRTVAHAASKAGVDALTRVMAIELAPAGIQVNAIASGPVETDASRELLTPDELLARRAGVPAGRAGRAEDIAAAAAFLASGDAEWITGSVLAVDGGYALPVKS
jgi:NAD(P)-dependent dehydrogenase (short-subunit alcohol dehydrogenase family)